MTRRGVRLGVIGGLVVLGGGWYFLGRSASQPDTANLADLVIPELTGDAQAGSELFAKSCAACHGENASGSDRGPPLVHPIYEPGHHGDAAFLIAAQSGVRAHHWNFGSMPPIEGVTHGGVEYITRYVRELQKANGIN